ncbi:archaeal proteasome endopeptidase complex subunit beta [Aeropyrum camini]|uniref:Proteasome subunit beta n=1 Tax=Aeropyrum camini SY1 = JCM 12091 TaxID=1198449 RepID=U3TBR1_9CREN|nr:archaeal proteasome endopeptidase complex subunit beta [Aeropyrum camini]BAN89861.1 proteasome beta subunit precursor [Aeropyrum camini SY1 = JCM 12091]
MSFAGATALGIRVNEGVVLAADKRMSYGGFILSRNFKKIFVINDRIGIAFAGLYGDMGGLVRVVEGQMRLASLETGRPTTVRNVAKFLSALLYSYKFFPFNVEAIVGGIDPGGEPKLYVLDPLGSIIEEDYVAAGTGASTAFGLLEHVYKPDMRLEEAKKAAVEALRASMARDAGTGDGIDVLVLPVSGKPRLETIKFRLVEG